MVNCDFENSGCSGGYMVNAIDFLMTEGTVTYGCKPYLNELDFCDNRCDDPAIRNTTEKWQQPKLPEVSQLYEKFYCKPGTLRIETSIYGI